MKNSFLKEFNEREYFNQCTNLESLNGLMDKKKIRAYIGFDCTAQSLHVGSLLQIMCLRLLQKHGHQPIILLGGGTTRIGDPSGKEETRKILTEKEIEKNIKNIKKVFSIFLNNKNSKQIQVWGTGDQMRDFIHIEDCIKGVVTTMDKIDDGSPINLSTGKLTSFKEFVKKLSEDNSKTQSTKSKREKTMTLG